MISKNLILSIFLGATTFSAYAHHPECNRDAANQWAHELAHVTDEFQAAVKTINHYEHLAYYAEEVHLAAHSIIDGSGSMESCNSLWRKFIEMRHDFYHLRDGHSRAQQKLPRFQISQVFQQVTNAYNSLQRQLQP
jgi:hypothetical protein